MWLRAPSTLPGLGSSVSLPFATAQPGLACLPFSARSNQGGSVATSMPCFSKHSGSLNTIGMCPILLDAMPDASAGWQGETRGDAVYSSDPDPRSLYRATLEGSGMGTLFSPPSTPPLSLKQWYGSSEVEAALLG